MNKYIESALNGIYEALIILSLLTLFAYGVYITEQFGIWSKEQLSYVSSFVIILFHYIAVKISGANIRKALENKEDGTNETK